MIKPSLWFVERRGDGHNDSPLYYRIYRIRTEDGYMYYDIVDAGTAEAICDILNMLGEGTHAS